MICINREENKYFCNNWRRIFYGKMANLWLHEWRISISATALSSMLSVVVSNPTWDNALCDTPIVVLSLSILIMIWSISDLSVVFKKYYFEFYVRKKEYLYSQIRIKSQIHVIKTSSHKTQTWLQVRTT